MTLNSKIRTENKLKTFLKTAGQKFSNFTRVTGLLASVISMHFLVIRPLVSRVDQLQSELHSIDLTLSRVAAEHSNLESTNDLLSELRTQHDEIAGARATLLQMQKLREEILIESAKIPDAMEAISRMSELPQQLHQSELNRYTTLTKPVPNPYNEQVSPAEDALSLADLLGSRAGKTSATNPQPVGLAEPLVKIVPQQREKNSIPGPAPIKISAKISAKESSSIIR